MIDGFAHALPITPSRKARRIEGSPKGCLSLLAAKRQGSRVRLTPSPSYPPNHSSPAADTPASLQHPPLWEHGRMRAESGRRYCQKTPSAACAQPEERTGGRQRRSEWQETFSFYLDAGDLTVNCCMATARGNVFGSNPALCVGTTKFGGCTKRVKM
jgi:hypothetical protein